jgi:hypothetical protein
VHSFLEEKDALVTLPYRTDGYDGKYLLGCARVGYLFRKTWFLVRIL